MLKTLKTVVCFSLQRLLLNANVLLTLTAIMATVINPVGDKFAFRILPKTTFALTTDHGVQTFFYCFYSCG